MKETLEVELPRGIKVKDKELTSVSVRIPTVQDELRAGEMARFQTPTGYTQVDPALQELHIVSAVANIPVSDLKAMSRVEYALLSDAVGKLEQSILLPPTTKSEENK